MKHSPWNAILYSANLDLCNSVTYGIHILDWSAFKQASAISDGHVLDLVFLRFGSLCFPGLFLIINSCNDTTDIISTRCRSFF